MGKLTIRKLKKLIEQEIKHDLANDHPGDIEPPEDAWEGGDNLVLNVNHATATSLIDDEEIPNGPESLDIVSGDGVMAVTESRLRRIIRRAISLRN